MQLHQFYSSLAIRNDNKIVVLLIDGLGGMLVTTRHGSVIIPADFPRRESKDNRMHACMRPGSDGGMRLICIFLPPAT